MATKTKTVRRRKGGTTNTRLRDWVREFVDLDTTVKTATARKDELKAKLLETVEREGYEDDKGNNWVDLPEEVEGVVRLKREKRVNQFLDEERMLALLEEKGLTDQCTRTIRVVDEEELQKAIWSEQVTMKEYKARVTKKVTYAFIPVKAK